MPEEGQHAQLAPDVPDQERRDIARPTLSSLLNAKAGLSGDMALRFEKAFGVDMETLMRLQNSFDIAQTRSRAKAIKVNRYHPRPAA